MWNLPLTGPPGLCRGKRDPKPPQLHAQPPHHGKRHKPTEASSRLCPGCAAAIIFPEETSQASHPSDTHSMIPSTLTSVSVLA